VSKWVLKIELDGEWEECVFSTREDALTAFTALATDYRPNLRRAVLLLVEAEANFIDTLVVEQIDRRYVN
jgi:hypothetical protein